jgi:site-specific DNA recombinase
MRNSTTKQAAGRAAIGYIRVSTTGQAEDGVSLAAQEQAIRVQCQAQGYRLLEIHADRGISGRRVDKRPGLLAAMDQACDTGGVLVCYSLSRLARNTRETLMLAERLEQAGADLLSLSERIDTAGACGRMVFRMLAVLAEFERDVISERTRMALGEKRRRGEKLGGRVPFGYRQIKRDDAAALVVDQKEQATISRIVSLREQGLTLRGIAGELERAGVSSKQGGRWHPKVISGILRASEPVGAA